MNCQQPQRCAPADHRWVWRDAGFYVCAKCYLVDDDDERLAPGDEDNTEGAA